MTIAFIKTCPLIKFLLNLMFYRSIATINIYDSLDLDKLATQMSANRYLKIIGDGQVQLLEDGYMGYVRSRDFPNLEAIEPESYAPPKSLTPAQIRERMPSVINYIQTAMQQPNEYLWGGTVPPNYDCSGLMQAAFVSAGIWIPRDAYQQEAFVNVTGSAIALDALAPGDLIFFGSTEKATHVGMYLGEGKYVHSSGRDRGRNGIGIDPLAGGNRVADWYKAQIRGAGRVTTCFQPKLITSVE
ncbi:C40 family peptidase [Pseudanabaena sp. PCC 6802]|uniref:C40 family peptidase n=1 Tax=Pseudanabaena sp. PCC 6802 TaxID=118173 RepID=UPI00034D989D|nr:C40 family peptidase [Pseudanabaena sp. PCC 6802]